MYVIVSRFEDAASAFCKVIPNSQPNFKKLANCDPVPHVKGRTHDAHRRVHSWLGPRTNPLRMKERDVSDECIHEGNGSSIPSWLILIADFR